jgi:hypothetical protein
MLLRPIRVRRHPIGGFAALFVSIVLGGCSPSGLAAPSAGARVPGEAWPAGTVLVLNEVPIRAEEVDAVGSAFATLEPQDTLLQLRRLALTNSIFPRIAAMGIDPAGRKTVHELAVSYLAALRGGGLPPGPLTGPIENERSGIFKELGFEIWRTAIDLEPGRWSEILESPGSFHILRVKSRKEGSLASLTRLNIGAFDFPFIQAETARADIEAALDRARLTILDPDWRDAVPAAWRYRLHVENP